jgi:hypothetical protein
LRYDIPYAIGSSVPALYCNRRYGTEKPERY